ncbi:calpastatin [Mycolicibacterium litorale]|nr:calpastatin [Mycolicibacterium litorale]
MDDPFDLTRFLDAQDGVYGQVCSELRAGAKRTHWIWFIFPQLDALGSSSTAKHFGIRSLAEARAYLVHPVLGARLRECARLVTAIEGRSVEDIFGWPDNLKVRSSMTLFARATEDNADFVAVLDKFYGGQPDARTLELL